MAIRRSVRDLSAAEKQNFVDGVLLLKHERTGQDNLSTFDRYVVIHNKSMGQYSHYDSDLRATMLERYYQTLPREDPNSRFMTRRNAAHRGPAFLPWHREFLRQFENDLQRVLGDFDFGLPYWDWEHDGDLPLADQKNTEVWKMLGGDGDASVGGIVISAPFGFDIRNAALLNDTNIFSNPKSWILVDPMGRQNGFLRRALGQAEDNAGNLLGLPTTVQVNDAIDNIRQYDDGNWDERSSDTNSFRCVLEGFAGPGALHNRVHQWVGGSMGPGTSPNDPVFFLHHCNVDRIWNLWESKHPGATYLPQSNGPTGHNWTDQMYPWDGMQTPLSITVEQAARYDDFEYAEPPLINA